ncbi:hypothetical protein GYMLUDRAFT_943709 [Collybiopsis luxurians FD-317 M1]|uniref:Unplaced genomic scaffold GYMLUscaffold_85, whole genome shotgun sequence n=1 Tax=Collybiopsis luxurians FD-317 M1 TaxID=944289 RepID=A0A0D0ARU0_9AGAR|nr:hypothetical protein GYMLUDRAFT_943709 [Collybiopsis luxurians FD-317 M1]
MPTTPKEILSNYDVSPFIMLVFEVLFYGAYIIIFGLYIYLQVHHQERQRYYQASICLLFALTTASVALAILSFVQLTFEDLLEVAFYLPISNDLGFAIIDTQTEISTLNNNLSTASRGIYAVANITADTLLLYRCYVLWLSRKWIIACLGIVSVINVGR